ncbi:MAG: DUF885 domain-containing protein [Rhodospirillaceae bacterium]|nr:DUF885 domain-containing protein [Rhodospirillaceae bacterium]
MSHHVPRFSSALSRRAFLASAAAGACAGPLRAEDALAATTRLNGWLETRFEAWVASSPLQQGYLGRNANLDKWDDLSEGHQREDLERARRDLADLRENFGPSTFTPEGQLSYRLYEYLSERRTNAYPWRTHDYTVNQNGGWQQQIAAFLMNIHRVGTVEQAEAYVARLHGIGGLMAQVRERMRAGEEAGVLAPRFVYGHVIRDCGNILSGAPFETGKASPLWADITAKIDILAADAATKQKLRTEAEKALLTAVRPAYGALMELCAEQQAHATTDDGVWKHPKGEEYYGYCLAFHTTTDMSADAIHEFGLAEVARIHDEMRLIMKQVEFGGSLQEFFTFLRTDARFRYPQTAEGKAAYLARAEEIIDAMRGRLDEVFGRQPRAKLVVRAVEAFREQSATAAFYQPPGAYDGRPGTYYVNTFDMNVPSKYEMEAVAYHEAIPGHHMQIALAREMSDLPSFRRFEGYSAYTEGWGLYCEQLPKELGFYLDPYSDFGRLSAELWRACRLVVDTGIHAPDKKWTRGRAIGYLKENTPNAEGDIVNSIERYIVSPGQATAYKIGLAKIMALRTDAKERLADKFDLRAFHEVVLSHGSVPLPILGENVEAWVRQVAET